MFVSSSLVSPDATLANLQALQTRAQESGAKETTETAPPSSAVILDLTAVQSVTTPVTYEAPSRYVTQASQAWLSRSEDAVSKLMARNFSSTGDGSRLNGLGRALLERFKTDASNFKQTVANFVPRSGASAAVDAASQSALDGVGNNPSAKISLSIRTRSGTVVDVVLTNQADGLGIEIHSSNALSAAESKALSQLSEGFEQAIQSFAAGKGQVDIAGLASFDTSVLSTIDLKASATRQGEEFSLAFHSDKAQRTLKMMSPKDQVEMKLDVRNSALWGPTAQRDQAIARHVQQIDDAGRRGHGNAEWIEMVKQAFTSMQQAYGPDAATGPKDPAKAVSAPAKVATPDTALLSGLADFELNIQSTPLAPNPMRLSETDTFGYQMAQRTTVVGDPRQPDSIRQKQSAALKASFHSGLNSADPLKLTSEKNSQNYFYTRIDDQASSEVTLRREPDQSLQASVEKSARQSTHVQKYQLAELVDDRTTPKERIALANLTDHLHNLQRQSDADIADRATKDLLRATGTNAVLLETDPDRL